MSYGPRPLIAREEGELEAAKVKGYLLTATCSDELRFEYRDQCRAHRVPLLLIRQGRKFARIELDLEPARRIFTDGALRAFYDYLNQKTAGSRPSWRSMLGKRSCDWERIPADDAEEIGRELLRLTIENSEPEPPEDLSWMGRA